MDNLLRIEKISKSVQSGEQKRELFTDLSLTVKTGEFIALGGRSGSGKTTLLNIIAGIDTQDAGSVYFKGNALESMSEAERSRLRLSSFGLVFQFFHLMPSMTLRENTLLPAYLLASSTRPAKEYAEELLLAVGIEAVADQYPHQVSGGEAQRAAIARALINRPDILLADEPTGNLDVENANAVLRLLRKLQTDREFTIVMVTHEDDVLQFADKALHLEGGNLK